MRIILCVQFTIAAEPLHQKYVQEIIAYVPVDYSVVSTIYAFTFTVCSSTVEFNVTSVSQFSNMIRS